MVSVGPAPQADSLSPEQERTVREAVYRCKPIVGTRDSDNLRVLSVPEPLEALYKKHPQAVVELLLVIADGARPWDSVLAAGYAMELLGGPGRGTVCIEVFDEKLYDSINKNWARSPRKHWIGKVREKLGAGAN